MTLKNYFDSELHKAHQEHVAILERHNEWLRDELSNLKKGNSDRDMRIYLILSWVIVVASLYPYL